MLQLDLSMEPCDHSNRGYDPIRRDGKLYDRQNHTFEWKQGTYYFDVLWLFDWIDLPKPIQNFIVSRSATMLSSRIIGDPIQNQVSRTRELHPSLGDGIRNTAR